MEETGAPAVRAVVQGLHGAVATVDEHRAVSVGRDPACDISFPHEARLSRRAVHISWNVRGIVIANHSRTHGLSVSTATSTARLPSRAAGPGTGFFLAQGLARVTAPTWVDSRFEVTVEVRRGADSLPSLVDPALSTTAQALELEPYTKEFLTALMLCRPRLTNPADLAPPPPVPHLTRRILETTNSWHLLREMTLDEAVRTRLTGRVHEHLKGLRAKIARHGLAPPHVPISPAVLVDVLTGSETITASHLDLLDDPGWLGWQETHWWEP